MDIEEAIQLQKELAQKVVRRDDVGPLRFIAGLDVSHNLYDPEERIFAAAALFSYPSLQQIEVRCAIERQSFPYIPGLLGFREAPSLIRALEQLSQKPDLIFVDGHGISHPRGLGIASHIGALTDIPSIGVAKTLLIGKPQGELGAEAGSRTPVLWRGEIVAELLRSKARCLPLIISCGHRISRESAVAIVQSTLRGYRLPEPTRAAHNAANTARKAFVSPIPQSP